MYAAPKFVNYTLVGVLFFIMQVPLICCLVFGFIDIEFIQKIDNMPKLGKLIPDYLYSSINALLAALALASVVSIGLLIDIVGSLLKMHEVPIFAEEIRRNEKWLRKLFQDNLDYVGNDYRMLLLFLEELEEVKRKKNLRSRRQKIYDIINEFNIFSYNSKKIQGNLDRSKISIQYASMFDFTFSYVNFFYGQKNYSHLHDQISFWKISQSIGALFSIISFEYLVIGFILWCF